MRQSLIVELDQILRTGEPVCYTALVETRGSTPQKAGASMLVFPDGSQRGTLGGGCVEAEVKRRALGILNEGTTELLSFQLDSDYGWDDGLICGGRMKMLVDPLRPGTDTSYFSRYAAEILADRPVTEAILIDSEKTGLGTAGDRCLLNAEGQVIAERRQANSQPNWTFHLRPLSERPRPYVAGGISYLPSLRRCRLLIVGAGHVGQRVAKLAAEVDFDVWVIDDREEYCNPDRFPWAGRLIVADIETGLQGLPIDSNTYVIIVTRGHNHDEEALFHVAETSARYVGLIGSKRKIKLIFDDLLREGISADALRRVQAPLGYDIGSQTVPEIAISIVAELVAHRNLGQIPERTRGANLLDAILPQTT